VAGPLGPAEGRAGRDLPVRGRAAPARRRRVAAGVALVGGGMQLMSGRSGRGRPGGVQAMSRYSQQWVCIAAAGAYVTARNAGAGRAGFRPNSGPGRIPLRLIYACFTPALHLHKHVSLRVTLAQTGLDPGESRA
jgi:hypothetical protein